MRLIRKYSYSMLLISFCFLLNCALITTYANETVVIYSGQKPIVKYKVMFKAKENGVLVGTPSIYLQKGNFIKDYMVPRAIPNSGFSFGGWTDDNERAVVDWSKEQIVKERVYYANFIYLSNNKLIKKDKFDLTIEDNKNKLAKDENKKLLYYPKLNWKIDDYFILIGIILVSLSYINKKK